MVSNDRRRYSRVNLHLEGSLTTSSSPSTEAVSVTVCDVSLKGALVRILRDEDLAKFKGGRYILKFKVDPTSHVTMTVNCRYTRDNNMGLQCEDIDVRSISFLRKIIEYNTGDISLLNRELDELMHSN